MSYQNPLSNDEQEIIGGELDILFACQGKNLSREIKAIWINEIDKSSIPTKAILQGILSLKGEDLNAIKLNILFAFARKFIEEEKEKSCNDCSTGYVVMKDEEKRSFVLRCKCESGRNKTSQNILAWNGKNEQYSKGRMLIKFPAVNG